jgi:hypothetical protein
MAMEMKQYWAFVGTGQSGSFIKVYITADSPYNALTILKATYGAQLKSGPSLVS